MFATIPQDLNQFYPAVPDSVRLARVAVGQFAAQHGLCGEQLDAVRTAVTEAVGNVVRHAYGGAPGAVYLTAVVTKDLIVLIADDGCGYQTPSSHPGLGLGLTLIAQYSSRYVIAERSTGGTEVRMRFPITARGEPAGG